MKIVIVGASGTMGSYLSNAFEKEHEVVRAGRTGADVKVDITSSDSIEEMYQQIGAFDALISTVKSGQTDPLFSLEADPFCSAQTDPLYSVQTDPLIMMA